jgi:hypothetical protein
MFEMCFIALPAENSAGGALAGTTAGVLSEYMPAAAEAAVTRTIITICAMCLLLLSFISCPSFYLYFSLTMAFGVFFNITGFQDHVHIH